MKSSLRPNSPEAAALLDGDDTFGDRAKDLNILAQRTLMASMNYNIEQRCCGNCACFKLCDNPDPQGAGHCSLNPALTLQVEAIGVCAHHRRPGS